MSQLVFPSDLPGFDIKVKRGEMYSTMIQAAASGKELRASFQSSPRVQYELTLNAVRQSGFSNRVFSDEPNQLRALMAAVRGRWDTFLFTDPLEPSLSGQAFGTGNGSTYTFQLCDSLGNPVYDLNGAPALTRTDWQGTVGLSSVARTNLLTYSEQIDNAAWQKNALGVGLAPVVTPNYGAAPDGTITADRVVFDCGAGATTGDRSRLEQSYAGYQVQPYTFSVWLKTVDGSSKTVLIGNWNSPAPIQTVTGTWQRFAFTITPGSAFASLVYIRLTATQTSQSADLLVWGAHLEPGSTATPNIHTDASPVTITDYTLSASGLVVFALTVNPITATALTPGTGVQTAWTLTTPNGSTPTVSNVWVTDWQGRLPRYATIRYNYLQFSQSIGSWSKSGAAASVITTDTIVAPDGTTTADVLDLTSAAVGEGIFAFAMAGTSGVQTGVGQTVTRSVWLKGASGGEVINLTDPTVGGTNNVTMTTAWQRFTYTSTAGTGTFGLWLRKVSGNVVHVWGGKIEPGSVATAYFSNSSGIAWSTVTDYAVSGSTLTFGAPLLSGAILEWDGSYVGAPAAGVPLRWSGGYYRRVRFDSDTLEFERIVDKAWDGKNLKLISVK